MRDATLIRQIVARLRENFTLLEKAARFSRDEATHESSKADNKYDTRGLEASYLARGQSRQAEELLDAIKLFEALSLRDFTPDDPIALTALVKMESNRTRSTYFIGPTSGGLEIDYQGEEVMVITPQSPLGRSLMGKKAGQHWTALLGGTTAKYRILSIQ